MKKEGTSIAVEAMQAMIEFLSYEEKEFEDESKEMRSQGNDSAADIFEEKSFAMYLARWKAESLLDWVIHEEAEEIEKEELE